ncbi:MAG: ATP-binding protein [Dermatophilaceae bacterium]
MAGPSGAGKSRLAAHLHDLHGWPIVRLDDFYRDGDDPSLPFLPMGVPDWDNPRSWDGDRAVQALVGLCENGAVDVPAYDISSSRALGHCAVTAEPGQLILAEGIFAADIIAALAAEDILAAAYCVHAGPWLTFCRRLVRDLAGRRKSPWVLWRRGLILCRKEPEIVARHVRLGARPVSAAEARAAITTLVDTPH